MKSDPNRDANRRRVCGGAANRSGSYAEPVRTRRLLRRSAIGLPAAGLLVGAAAWLLGLTPLPPAPAALTELVATTRRASVMARGIPVQSWHVPTMFDWLRAGSVHRRSRVRSVAGRAIRRPARRGRG